MGPSIASGSGLCPARAESGFAANAARIRLAG
jgi:hypothetical protein